MAASGYGGLRLRQVCAAVLARVVDRSSPDRSPIPDEPVDRRHLACASLAVLEGDPDIAAAGQAEDDLDEERPLHHDLAHKIVRPIEAACVSPLE